MPLGAFLSATLSQVLKSCAPLGSQLFYVPKSALGFWLFQTQSLAN